MPLVVRTSCRDGNIIFSRIVEGKENKTLTDSVFLGEGEGRGGQQQLMYPRPASRWSPCSSSPP